MGHNFDDSYAAFNTKANQPTFIRTTPERNGLDGAAIVSDEETRKDGMTLYSRDLNVVPESGHRLKQTPNATSKRELTLCLGLCFITNINSCHHRAYSCGIWHRKLDDGTNVFWGPRRRQQHRIQLSQAQPMVERINLLFVFLFNGRKAWCFQQNINHSHSRVNWSFYFSLLWHLEEK